MAKHSCNRCGRDTCRVATLRTQQMVLLTKRPGPPPFELVRQFGEDARAAQDACDTGLAERRIARRRQRDWENGLRPNPYERRRRAA